MVLLNLLPANTHLLQANTQKQILFILNRPKKPKSFEENLTGPNQSKRNTQKQILFVLNRPKKPKSLEENLTGPNQSKLIQYHALVHALNAAPARTINQSLAPPSFLNNRTKRRKKFTFPAFPFLPSLSRVSTPFFPSILLPLPRICTAQEGMVVTSSGPSSWGTPPISAGGAHSASTSGSAGSPPIEPVPAAAAMTPVSESTFVRLNNLDIHADDAADTSQGANSNKKKKRAQRAVGPDKTGRGLRQFSMKVCEKVESKGRTTYNEVADELVAEFTDPSTNFATPDQQQYDEKNIRRRVYDALNVLMAMDIISKDKKDIQWKGLPRTSLNDVEELRSELMGVKGRIDKKAAYLQELQDKCIGLQNLVQRNEQLYGSGNSPSGAVALPFILVQTRPHATVEVEISEDMQLVHFDFNSTPFELRDDDYVLKAMRFSEKEQNGNGVLVHHEPSSNPNGECSNANNNSNNNNNNNLLYQQNNHAPVPILVPQRPTRPNNNNNNNNNNNLGKVPTSPSVPGILKGRVKHEQ
ncbi:hypothetical protein LUZ60_015064 [Juncus effusus]|nr:hypothetical protein LUZ60_015064 [Juncus effusus]